MANVLRYPYEALTEKTDYLQITLIDRNFAGKDAGLIRNAGFANVGGTGKIRDVSSRRGNPSSGEVLTSGGIILLPMPSSIVDANSVNYSEDSLDAITATVAGGALNLMGISADEPQFLEKLGTTGVKFATDLLKGGDLKEIYLKKLAAEAASIAGVGNITLNQILARGEGQILNPNMELLFNGPTIRNFKFSFKMTPRDEDESKQVKLIIRSLKKHMSPISAGTFLKTPNFFELRYRTGNKDHEFLHRFKQCVLSDISVNYTGENVYATYSDGTPVSMIMDLTFKELEPVYSDDYTDSVGGVGF
jgi:hypothetical protein